MPAAFPPCVGRGSLTRRFCRVPAGPRRRFSPCKRALRDKREVLCYDGGERGEAYARHRPQSEVSAAAEGADPGGAGRPAPRDPAGGEQLGAEPEPARAGDTPLRGGASGGRRGRAALWSPAGGGSGGPGKPAEAHGYRRGAVGRLGGAVAGLPALGAPGA